MFKTNILCFEQTLGPISIHDLYLKGTFAYNKVVLDKCLLKTKLAILIYSHSCIRNINYYYYVMELLE